MNDRIALLERRNELRARLYRLAGIRREMDEDTSCLTAEVTVTNNMLRDVEIDLADMEKAEN